MCEKFHDSCLLLLVIQFLSDFDQLPHNVPISATVADVEEKRGFMVYFVSPHPIYLKITKKKKFRDISWGRGVSSKSKSMLKTTNKLKGSVLHRILSKPVIPELEKNKNNWKPLLHPIGFLLVC